MNKMLMMKKRTYHGEDLKLWAMWSMLIDHAGAVLIENTSLYQITGFRMLAVACRLIGRISFPLICFLLIEGFCHTEDRRKYLMRMGCFALISEIPFDLAFFSKLDLQRQNVFFTLFTGILLLYALEKAETLEHSPLIRSFMMAAAILAGCAAATAGRFDYSYMGILLIAALYLFRKDRKKQCIAGAVLSLYELTAALAFILVGKYNGEKGDGRLPRNWFYIFYPLHLLVLSAIVFLLKM
ncbi:conjugal transfer protein TraX [bacterium]|nr:conjugal transfer protein TraX [bacterium]MDY4503576.1 TraX family protein [Bariatricus sp.]